MYKAEKYVYACDWVICLGRLNVNRKKWSTLLLKCVLLCHTNTQEERLPASRRYNHCKPKIKLHWLAETKLIYYIDSITLGDEE